MNKILYFFLAICLFQLLLACTVKSSVNDGSCVKEFIVNIDKPEIPEFSSIIDSVRYVKLEATDESLISDVNKLVCRGNFFYVLDQHTNSICVYDINGFYKYKIAHQGAGPDEYVGIDDFVINDNLSSIDILDGMRQKIMRYDMNDGRFLNSISLSHYTRYISSVNNGYLSYDFKTGIVLLDSIGTKMKSLVEFEQSLPVVASDPGCIYCIDGKITFLSLYDNIVYDGEDSDKKYRFLFTNYLTPADYLGYTVKNLPEEFSTKGLQIFTHKESDNWIYQQYGLAKDNTVRSFLYSKNSDSIFAFGPIKNFFDIIFPVTIQHDIPNCIVNTGPMPILEIKKIIESNPTVNFSNEFKNVILNSKEDDNPILQLFYLK